MKKILKKLLMPLCALGLCIVMLSGCSWLKIDNEKYYNQTVVKIVKADNDKAVLKEYSKKDLIDAFSSYGYQYYQSGQSMEESIKSTIGNMIDRDLLLDDAKKTASLNDTEKLEVLKAAFEYMQDSIYTFETKIRKEWDMTIETEEAEETKTLRATKTEYTPKTEYDEITGEINRVKQDSEKIFTDGITLNSHFTKSMQVVTDVKVSNEAWTRYVKSLQDGAKSEGRSIVESDVVRFEEDRLVKLLTNNKILEKYQDQYLSTHPVETSAVLQYYKSQYNTQKQKYNADPSAYHTDMKDASKNMVFYHPVEKDMGYVNVKHILIKFNDAQTKELTSLKNEYSRFGIKGDDSEEDKTNPKYAEYKVRFDRIVENTTSTFEKDGETYTWNVRDVYNYVKSYATGTPKEISKKFEELVYIFNDDEGFMNSEFDYVVNLDTTVTDQMVKPFANGVRALDTSNGGHGAGSMDMVITEYGYHIILHDGNAENLVSPSEINSISDEALLRLLCTTTTTPSSNKTLFNYIYDTLKIEDNSYNNMTQEVVANLRTQISLENYQIVYYENNYKDLWD